MKFLLMLAAVSAFGADLAFEKIAIKVGGASAKVGLADTDEKREHGLMFVKSMPADEGMLFVFEDEQPRAFWMKNTLIPLSIAFFDKNGVVIDIQEMKPAESLIVRQPPTYPSAGPAQFALEMNTGWFAAKHLKKGARLQLVGPTQSALLKRTLAAGRSSGANAAPTANSGK
jgi:uncharacterized protein